MSKGLPCEKEKFLDAVRASYVFDYLTSGIIVTNECLYCTVVNKSIGTIFNLDVSTLVGSPVQEVLRKLAPEFETMIKEINSGGMLSDYELAVNISKEIKYLLINVRQILNEDNIFIGLAVTMRDITTLKLRQEQDRVIDRLTAMSQLASCLAHEVRNPLTSVKGFLQLASLKENYVFDRNIIRLMLDDLMSVEAMITEFLQATRPSQGKIALCDLNRLVYKTVLLMEAYARENNVVIKTEFKKGPLVELDEGSIRQVLINLIKNAIEACPNQGGEVTVSTDYDNSSARIGVEDNGQGMSKEVLDNIGKAYFTTKENGTGLGLVVCWNIITQHKGVMSVHSTPSKGTIFNVNLPLGG
ncbi:MAG: kinE [Peptococcaceae bacterium]|jgi:nitrogen fixation/metabolism regulation signal transduction histidine kinase|nr:kinE [Peptococcaceae bacterium]